MRLLKFKYRKIPRPMFGTIDACQKYSQPEIGGNGAITQDELKCLPYISPPLAPGVRLVPSSAGSAGVYGG